MPSAPESTCLGILCFTMWLAAAAALAVTAAAAAVAVAAVAVQQCRLRVRIPGEVRAKCASLVL